MSEPVDKVNGDHPLRTQKCTIRFGGLVAVNELDMNVRRGEIYGLIGPNGAGKTTVFNLLTGVYEPTDGTIEFEGKLQAGPVPLERGRRMALLAMDAVLAALGGYIVGTIVFSSIIPNDIPSSELFRVFALAIHSWIVWMFVVAAAGYSLITA